MTVLATESETAGRDGRGQHQKRHEKPTRASGARLHASRAQAWQPIHAEAVAIREQPVCLHASGPLMCRPRHVEERSARASGACLHESRAQVRRPRHAEAVALMEQGHRAAKLTSRGPAQEN